MFSLKSEIKAVGKYFLFFPLKNRLKKEEEKQKFPNIESLLMKKITHSTSAYFVYELKGFHFLIFECYGNTDSYNTPYINLKPTAINRNCGKLIKIHLINRGN